MVIEVKQNGKFVKIPYITADVPVSEAPIDGKQYARQDATWSEIVIPEVDLTEIETNIAANTQAISANTAYIATLNSTVSNLPTAGSIVVTTDPRLTAATTTKAGLMSAADKVQLDSTLTATEIENKVNAAVSSVYRVKGNVATVSNLPTSNVAIGDVYNITDSGANYVAVNNNPVEWDKLSETVDLAPYMQTSTANSTFVKKSGDTMTGELIVNRSYFPYFTAAKTGSDVKLSMGVGDNGECILRRSVTNSASNADLSFTQNELTYKNVPVALTDSAQTILVRKAVGDVTLTRLKYGGIEIVPENGLANTTGIEWKKQNGSDNLFRVGALTRGDDEDTSYLFMGWGATPFTPESSFLVSQYAITYKNNNIWHAGNDGAGSGLDADTVDGIHANDFFIGNLKSITKESIANGASFQDLSSGSFPVTSGASASALFSFKCPSASTSAIQFHATYDGSSIGYRTQVDNNRYTNWQNVSLGPSTSVLTQAEYNALGSTVNSDGKIYFIKE